MKISWARERSGYLAYCGSDPMVRVDYNRLIRKDRGSFLVLRRLGRIVGQFWTSDIAG